MGLGSWIRQGEKIKPKIHRHTQQCGDIQRERVVGVGEVGQRGDKWGQKEILLWALGA